MINTRRSKQLLALAVGASLLAAACGDDDDDSGSEATTETTAGGTDTTAGGTETTAGGSDTTEAGGSETTAPAGDVAMTVTIDINPDAVWDDGSPITATDFQCTWNAQLNTPGSIETVGYDRIVSVEPGDSDKQVVISFNEPYAAYKGLFDAIIKADAVEDCNDISGDFETEIPFSGKAWKLDSFAENQMILVPNENYWGEQPAYDRLVVVGLEDSDTEIAALKSGEVDFIYPQFYAGIEEALADPNVTVALNYGGDYEALYFQQLDGPFADPVYREAFAKSIDRDALFQQIYAPIAADRPLLQCGPIVPGKYCDDAFAEQVYDPTGAEQLLTDAGWTKNGDGFWADPDGNVPEVRWMVNTGNTRRESTQAYLIPLLAEAGFNVVADNCEALPCVFQQRLPSLDYDLGMYISTAPPDPSYLVSSFTCDQIPSEENGNQGQNQQGWCNEEASAELEESDITVDPDARAELIKSAIQKMADDSVLMPLFQFPKSGAYRTDRVGGTVEDELNNYRAFNNSATWTDVDGDGQIIIGAEQYPGCLNPVNECANSSWYVWVGETPVLPGVWITTNDQDYVPTDLVVGEPVVEVANG